jgi:molybdopterin-binding protein
MNKFKAQIKRISTKDSLNIVEFNFADEHIYMMSLELKEDILNEKNVYLGIKPMNVAIAKKFDVGMSFLNQLKVSIVNIDEGELLCSVKGAIDGTIIESVITKKAFLRMNLQVGDSVVMLLPASEIFIV